MSRVVILGASNQPGRYSNMALHSLISHGHEVVPVHPVIPVIDGIKVTKKIADITGEVDTVTLYIGSSRVEEIADEIIGIKSKRIIANPGTETETLKKKALQAGIEYIEGCTLVMLSSGLF
ncbi:MAG TPA: CoA-binding protein [bacterium]|jgi:predicted CoA-binding protein|nr:CoA-binding protein [bacterium]HPM46541.1 CoA-binding protein [bacterium]HRQ70701.1 CoA-binding protein [bacterium]